MKYIKRLVEKEILERAKKSPVISLMGPRQSGKTTLAKNLFSDYVYVNLEFPEIRRQAETDPRSFLTQAKKMIIDEAQRVPSLFSYIQGFVDEDKEKKYVLTGSSNFLLMKNISQSLAGRVAIFKILPFSKGELQHGGYKIGTLEEMIFKGGYPRVWVNNEDANFWYNDYIQTYVEKDVRGIHGINLFENFYIFLKVLANQVGNELNLADIAKHCGVSPNTISGWVSLLEESFIMFKLRPEYNNLGKKLVKSPKIYFYDTGLVCTLLNINKSEGLKKDNNFGKLFENFVVLEIMKKNILKNVETTYYREYAGLEVDLLIKDGEKNDLVEIKSNFIYDTRDAKNLYLLDNLMGKKGNIHKLVYAGELSYHDKKLQVLSWRDL